MQYNAKKELLNAEGKRILEQTKLEYSQQIIDKLKGDVGQLDGILDELELTQEDFFRYLSGEENTNITFYDQTLNLTKKN